MESERNSVTDLAEVVRAGCDEPRTWRQAMKDAVRSAAELCRLLELPEEFVRRNVIEFGDFPVFAPREFVSRMVLGDPHDPLLRQVLATKQELESPPGFTTDPVGDLSASPTAGFIRKYASRALLIVTGACAIHCRYCFRRHFPYESTPKALSDQGLWLDAIAADPEIDEVILSGGDPLTLGDEPLAALAQRIAEIPHVRRLRIHTRLPIVIPQRVTGELLSWLRGTRLTPIMVVHANHANEIDHATGQALTRMVDAGIPVLNQTVLLAGVNDSTSALVDLSRRLIDLRVMPYYLHQLDRVTGAAHFETTPAQGMLLVQEMRESLPGYAVPRLVRETAGDPAKRILA